MAGGTPFPGRIGRDFLPLRDKFHHSTFCLEPFNTAFQEHLGAPHSDGFLENTIGHVPESVPAAVDTHKSLGAIIVWRDFFVGDRPPLEISWTESQTMTRPAQ